MIRAGGRHLLKVCCLNCGTPCEQEASESDFFFICCQNEKCEYRYANVVIEKRTGIVIACDAILMTPPESYEPKRVWPAYYWEDGTRVWPKPEDK